MSTYGFDMKNPRHFFAAMAIVLLPMLFIIGQRETGSALVYLAFFLMFYREGMPGAILFTGVAMVIYFVVGIKYEQVMLWDTPTSVGKFVVLLLVQLFSASMVYIYANDKQAGHYRSAYPVCWRRSLCFSSQSLSFPSTLYGCKLYSVRRTYRLPGLSRPLNAHHALYVHCALCHWFHYLLL